ncbi:MAG: sialate O-acetylesterase, partial [Planctomycetaceae bacterium]|nr:sialate O-acetylesterase [Planctomycetaceae bacterium]
MKKIFSLTMLSLVALLFCTTVVHAEVRLPAVFSDNMVLQRDMPIPIWGWADPGEKVTVSINGQTQKAVAAENGKWSLKLDAMPAGGP